MSLWPLSETQPPIGLELRAVVEMNTGFDINLAGLKYNENYVFRCKLYIILRCDG